MFHKILFISFIAVNHGFPTNIYLQSVAENNNFDDFDNYIPRYDDLPLHSHSSLNYLKNETISEIPYVTDNNKDIKSQFVVNVVTTADGLPTLEIKDVTPVDGTTATVDDFVTQSDTTKKKITTTMNIVTDPPQLEDDTLSPERDSKGIKENLNITFETKKPQITEIINSVNIKDIDSAINITLRNPREEGEKDEESEEKTKESQEDGSSEEEEEEEEDMNMITGLLSALLGGLSKPDGGIDLDAIVGLIGSLSEQRDDGTYDFSGLTELLKGFFGGGGDGGGGSDIGAFTGGLLGAVLKGIANPPGGKGIGILTAKLLAGILPALSVPEPDPDMKGKPSFVKPGGIDIGGFLGGFIKTLFGASKDINPVKFVISTITSLSNSKPKQDWQPTPE